MELFTRAPLAAHGGARYSPPIHLVIHPDEPIRSLDAAAKVIRRDAGDYLDRKARNCCTGSKALDPRRGRRHRRGLSRQGLSRQGFRTWAEAEGLLLVPPDDDEHA